MIIAVVGMSGVGKSVAVGYLCDQLDAPLVYFGGLVVDEVARRGQSGPEAEQAVRNELRAEHGMAAIAHLALPEVRSKLEGAAHVVIDGVYSFPEEELLRAEFGDTFTTLAIHSPKAERYRRLAIRPHRPLTRVEVDQRDTDETTRMDKARPIALADHHVVNAGAVEDLHADLAEILAGLGLGA